MKFGILGEAKIAREYVVPALINAGHEVTVVGRRLPGQTALPAIYGDAIETDYESLIPSFCDGEVASSPLVEGSVPITKVVVPQVA